MGYGARKHVLPAAGASAAVALQGSITLNDANVVAAGAPSAWAGTVDWSGPAPTERPDHRPKQHRKAPP